MEGIRRTVRLTVLGALLVVGTNTVSAQTVDVNLNSDAAELAYIAPLNVGSFGRSSWDVGLLFVDRNIGDDYSLLQLGMTVAGDAGTDAPGLQFGAGFRFYLADLGRVDVSAIAVSGLVRYAPPGYSRFFTSINLDYAPDITTFQDGDNFYKFGWRFGYEILPEADVYIGYRNIEAGLKNRGPDAEIEQGGFMGLRISF